MPAEADIEHRINTAAGGIAVKPGLFVQAVLQDRVGDRTVHSPRGVVTALVFDTVAGQYNVPSLLCCHHTMYNWSTAKPGVTRVGVASLKDPNHLYSSATASRSFFEHVQLYDKSYGVDAAIAHLDDDLTYDGQGQYRMVGTGSPIWRAPAGGALDDYGRIHVYSVQRQRGCQGKILGVEKTAVASYKIDQGRAQQQVINKLWVQMMQLEMDPDDGLQPGDSGAAVYNERDQLIGVILMGDNSTEFARTVYAAPIQGILSALQCDLYVGRTLKGNEAEVHRYYSQVQDRHFYTVDPREVTSEWIKERSLGYASVVEIPAVGTEKDATVPIYQYFNHRTQDNFYTPFWFDKRNGADFYRPRGVAFYGFRDPAPDRVPVRAFKRESPQLQHFYTEDLSREPRWPPGVWTELAELCYVKKMI